MKKALTKEQRLQRRLVVARNFNKAAKAMLYSAQRKILALENMQYHSPLHEEKMMELIAEAKGWKY